MTNKSTLPPIDPERCPISGETRIEERLNSLTHLFGLLLAAALVPTLIVFAAIKGSALAVVSVSLYGAALIATYLASTVYHAARQVAIKRWLQRLDHASIYLLIAGTYGPFLLVALGGGWGWSLMGVLWGMAALGVGFKLISGNRYERLSMLVYLIMGWSGLVAIYPLIVSLPLTALILIVAGGFAYTLGALFYMWESLPANHAIWHLFCLAGSACQGIAIFFVIT